jgi:hypothetical protein
MGAMGVLLTCMTGLVLWIVLWAIGVKSIDAFFATLALALIAIGVHVLTKYLPGRGRPE